MISLTVSDTHPMISFSEREKFRIVNKLNSFLSIQILHLVKAAIKPLNCVDLFYLTFVQEIKPNFERPSQHVRSW